MSYLGEKKKGKHKGHDSQQLMNEGVITNTFMSRINAPEGKTEDIEIRFA